MDANTMLEGLTLAPVGAQRSAPWSVIASRTQDGALDYPVIFICHRCGHNTRTERPVSVDVTCKCGATFLDSSNAPNVLNWARYIVDVSYAKAYDNWA